jgi:hypothetical protein
MRQVSGGLPEMPSEADFDDFRRFPYRRNAAASK